MQAQINSFKKYKFLKELKECNGNCDPLIKKIIKTKNNINANEVCKKYCYISQKYNNTICSPKYVISKINECIDELEFKVKLKQL